MKFKERIAGVLPAPSNLYASFREDDGSVNIFPEDKVIALVIIETASDDGKGNITVTARLDGLMLDTSEDAGLVREVGNFAGFKWGISEAEEPKGAE